jgi:hypothetical protein
VPLGSGNSPVTSTVSSSAEGYWPQSKTVRFEAGVTATTDFDLLRTCPLARVVGTVVNAETQQPIAGAQVQGGGGYVWTDPAGRFELDDIAPGVGNAPLDVWIQASAAGFFTASKTVTVYCGATVSVLFGTRQNDSGVIAGTVTNADTGKPIAGVFVGSEFGGTATTDAAGNYRIARVPLGDLDADKEWNVTAVATGFKQQTKSVVARAGAEVRADFAFSVAGNHRPAANPQRVEVDEDHALDVTLAGSDSDGDGLVYHVMRYPEHGTLSGSPPDVWYRPDPNYNGADDFAFATSDGLAMSEPATVDVVVRPVNDNPFAATDFVTIDEGTQTPVPVADLLANDVDVDGDTPALDFVWNFDYRVSVTQFGDVLLLTPAVGFTGYSTFAYAISDGHGGSATGYVNVTVRNVPDAPVCGDAAFAGTKDQALTGTLACTDADRDSLTYAVVDSPEHGSLVLAPGGGFTYTPAPGFRGPDSFTFTASDGTLTSRVATAQLAITASNEPPVADGDAYETAEDTPLSVAAPGVLADDRDPDGDTLELRLVAGPAHGTLVHGADGSFTYEPAPDFHGSDSFAYRARDGEEESATATVAITVRPVNDAPVCRDVAVATNEDERASVAPDCTDVDGDPLVYDVVAQPDGMAHVAFADGTLAVVPEPDANGGATARYRATDGSLASVASIAIAILPVNDPPVADDASVALAEDAPPVAIDLASHVADVETGDEALAYEIVSRPEHGTLTGSGPGFAYDSDENFNGADVFRYRVADESKASEVRTVELTIAPVNDAPAVDLAPAGPVDEGAAPIDLRAAASDVDGDALTYAWSGADGDGAEARFARDDGPGAPKVSVVVSDGHGGEARAETAIEVRNVAPHVDAGPDASGYWGVPIRLAGFVADPSAADTAAGLRATWSFGDGTNGAGPAAEHVFAGPGAYTAVLSAHDKDGGDGEDSVQVTVAKRSTRLVYTGPARTPFGATVLSARLEDAVDAPTAKLGGKLVEFRVGGATIIALTDGNGVAAVSALTTGGPVAVDFAGDALYEPTRTQADLAVDYDFGGAGFFAVGDASAAVGATSTFWSSTWADANALDAPSAFKGWVARDGAPACGRAWTTGPGDSSDPPAAVPRYLAVVVTSAVGKSGSDITGTTAGIVVVETQSGYGAAPGHTGTGTVVARIC